MRSPSFWSSVLSEVRRYVLLGLAFLPFAILYVSFMRTFNPPWFLPATLGVGALEVLVARFLWPDRDRANRKSVEGLLGEMSREELDTSICNLAFPHPETTTVILKDIARFELTVEEMERSLQLAFDHARYAQVLGYSRSRYGQSEPQTAKRFELREQPSVRQVVMEASSVRFGAVMDLWQTPRHVE